MKKFSKQKGYAVLELLFYIAFFAILTTVVINAMIAMTTSFRETGVYTDLMRTGNVMERMSREIRRANGVQTLSGSLLKLNTTDEADLASTVQFSLTGDDVSLYENDTLIGGLNAEDVEITALSFTEITTTEGKAIKVVLSARSKNDKYGRTADFYDTVVMRGSY